LSFHQFSILKNKPAVFIGLENYSELLHDPNIWERFIFTGKFVFTAVTLELVFGS